MEVYFIRVLTYVSNSGKKHMHLNGTTVEWDYVRAEKQFVQHGHINKLNPLCLGYKYQRAIIVKCKIKSIIVLGKRKERCVVDYSIYSLCFFKRFPFHMSGLFMT